MAELPRYRRRLTRLEIPTPSFAAQKSLVAYQQQMVQDLASMNKFVFESLQGVVKERAKVYGVEQAPDMEQIETIYNWNKQIDDAQAIKEEDRTEEQQTIAEREKKTLGSPGDTYSVFGTTANEYFLAQSLDTMKVFGKKKILELLQQAQIDGKKYVDVKPQVEAIVEGLTDSISEQDVRLGKSLNADLGMFGYTQLNAFMDDEITETKAEKKRLFAATKEIFFNNLAKEIMYQGGGDALSDPKIPEKIKANGELPAIQFRSERYYNLQFESFLAMAMENKVDVSNINALRKEFNDELYKATLTVINSALLTNDDPDTLYNNTQAAVTSLIKLRDKNSGSLGAVSEKDRKVFARVPKKVLNALVTMDETQLLNALDQMRKFVKEEKQFAIDQDDQAVKLRDIDVEKNQQAFGTALAELKEDMSNKDTVVTTLQGINAKILKLDSSPDGNYFTNLEIIAKIQGGINTRTTKEQITFSVKYHNDSNADNPKYTTLDVAKDFADGKLGFEDFKTFTKTYGAIQDKDFTAALNHARTKMGIPDVTLFNGKSLKEANYDMYNTYKNLMIEAKLNTPANQVFDPQKYNKDNLDDFIRDELTETVNSKYADLTLKKKSGEYAANTKQLDRFIQQCLGKPQFADRCEKLIEFKEQIIEYNESQPGLEKPISGFEGLSFD